MARKKKDEEILDDEIEVDEDEELDDEDDEDDEDEEEDVDEEDLDDEDDDEDEEEDLDEEARKKEPAGISVSEDDEEAAKEPKPRKRAPRAAAKKAAPVKKAAAAAAVVAPPATTEEIAPVAPAAVVAEPEKDPMTRQWDAARQTSESIVASLEKVNSLLKELPDHYAAAFQKSIKSASPKTSPAAKIAFGLSMVAMVLSVLSMSFSQSARQAVLSRPANTIPAVHAAAKQEDPIDMLAALEGKPSKNKKSKKTR